MADEGDDARVALANFAGNLPDDFLAEIIVRLPIDDVGKWMLTSRTLYRLITSHFFCQMWIDFHYPRLQQDAIAYYLDPDTDMHIFATLNLLHFEGDEPFEDTEMESIPHPVVGGHYLDNVHILGSTKGLILLIVGDTFLVWNPLLKMSSVIVQSPPGLPISYDNMPLVGFGSVGDTFSIVVITRHRRNHLRLVANVLELGLQMHWVQIDSPVEMPISSLLADNDLGYRRIMGLVNDHVMVWKVYTPNCAYCAVWGFDLRDSTFFDNGSFFDGTRSRVTHECLSLVVLSGELYATIHPKETCDVNLWKLVEFPNWGRWTKMATFNIEGNFDTTDVFEQLVATTLLKHRLILYTSDDHIVCYDPIDDLYFFLPNDDEDVDLLTTYEHLEVVSYQQSFIWPYPRFIADN